MASKRNGRRRPSTRKERKQAIVWTAVAVLAVTAMVAIGNPWAADSTAPARSTAETSAARQGHDAKRGKTATKTGDDLDKQAAGMFTGDAYHIADEVRDLLNAPEDSNVDTLSNLLYRHGDKNLAEATELYDAIGSERDIATIRSLARKWYPKAMKAAIEDRREDLSSGLAGAQRAARSVERLGLTGTKGCGDLADAHSAAKRLIDSGSDDYDALTKAQQSITSAISGCASNLKGDDLTRVFGQPQGTTDGGAK